MRRSPGCQSNGDHTACSQVPAAVIFPPLLDTEVEGLIALETTGVKAGIHPQYQRAVVQCACGNTFETRSTLPSIHVEICARCHPFFTGKQKLVDTAGRVERFRQRYSGTVKRESEE